MSPGPSCRSDVTLDVTSQAGLTHWELRPDLGCNPTPTTASGFSPLCWAEERGHSPVTIPRATTACHSHGVLAASAETAAAAAGGAGWLAENTRGCWCGRGGDKPGAGPRGWTSHLLQRPASR